MSCPFGAVRWEEPLLLRRFRIENQEHAFACPKENVPPRFFADQFQAKDILIECFGPVEVIDIESGFDKMLDARIAHGSLPQIEEHNFGGFGRTHRHAQFIADGSAIACSEALPIDVHRSSKNLNPCMAAGLQNVG